MLGVSLKSTNAEQTPIDTRSAKMGSRREHLQLCCRIRREAAEYGTFPGPIHPIRSKITTGIRRGVLRW